MGRYQGMEERRWAPPRGRAVDREEKVDTGATAPTRLQGGQAETKTKTAAGGGNGNGIYDGPYGAMQVHGVVENEAPVEILSNAVN